MKRLNLTIILCTTITTIFLLTGIAFADPITWYGNDPGDIYYNNGNVGIGTTSPDNQLHIVSSTVSPLKMESTHASHVSLIQFKSPNSNTSADNSPAIGSWDDDFTVYTNGTKRLHVTYEGNVGIGTTSPTNKLQIVGDSNYLLRINQTGTNVHNTMFANGSARFEAFTDNANNKVGLLSADSDDSFFIATADNINNGLIINSSGNVGIGTTSPTNKLQIVGDSNYLLRINQTGTNVHNTMFANGSARFEAFTDNANNKVGLLSVDSDDSFFIATADNINNGLIINSSGKVGIGTTNPGSYKLAVKGKIRAEEVVVETGWSDFVFEESYNLPSLSKVESYIKEYNHLPDIPSAKEVKEKGLSVSEMLAKQMQKIEELTLYLIEQNKRLEAVSKENTELKARVMELEEAKGRD